jgi:hypothetical protein
MLMSVAGMANVETDARGDRPAGHRPLLLTLLGCFITFAPPGETLWFGIAAVLAAFGLRSSRWWVKAVAVVLVLLLMSPVWFGYQRGSWR